MYLALQGVLVDGSVVVATGQTATAAAQAPISIGIGETMTVDVTVVGPDSNPFPIAGGTVHARIERRDQSELVHRYAPANATLGAATRLVVHSAETALWAPQQARWVVWVTTSGGESYPVMLGSPCSVLDVGMAVDEEGTS